MFAQGSRRDFFDIAEIGRYCPNRQAACLGTHLLTLTFTMAKLVVGSVEMS